MSGYNLRSRKGMKRGEIKQRRTSLNTKNIMVTFNNQTEELLRIYDSGESIVKFLTGDTKYNKVVCSGILGKHIKINEELGRGVFGAVYSISLPGTNNRQYVLKQTLNTPDSETMSHCLVTKTQIYQNNSTDKQIIVNQGNYVCNNEMYSEYMIGILVAQLFKNGLVDKRENNYYNINFIDVLNFTTCYKPSAVQYIFMERITTDLDSFMDKYMSVSKKSKGGSTKTEVKEINMISIIYQLIIAILFYQDIYKISHNDLHAGNIFLEKITDNTMYAGKNIKGYTHLSYKIKGKTIYIPLGEYIVKIGDWGQACKYSPRQVLNYMVMDERFYDEKPNGEIQYTTPNWFSKQYDFVYSLGFIYKTLKMYGGTRSRNPTLHKVKDMLDIITHNRFNEYERTSYKYRPQLELMKGYMTPIEFLRDEYNSWLYTSQPNSLKVGKL